MSQFRQLSLAEHRIIYDSAYFPQPSVELFTQDFWQQQAQLTGHAKGRGTTVFFKEGNREYVLRQYKRGGLIGKLIDRTYLYWGLKQTRAWQELHLLAHMQALGLPCPTPVAADIRASWGRYRASLITLRIEQAVDLHHELVNNTLSGEQWYKIGETIAQFHNAQIYHHDLNIRNIMQDVDGKIWLIDFDKCAVKKGTNWKSQNLDRLLRSLNKEKGKPEQTFHFQPSDWLSLMDGYHSQAR